MNAKWSVFKGFEDPSIGMVSDEGMNSRGGKMLVADAQVIVDSHNRCNDPKWIQDFAFKASQFINDQVSTVVDEAVSDDRGQYWMLVGMMTATLAMQLQSAVNGGLVKLKPEIINRGEVDGDPK